MIIPKQISQWTREKDFTFETVESWEMENEKKVLETLNKESVTKF